MNPLLCELEDLYNLLAVISGTFANKFNNTPHIIKIKAFTRSFLGKIYQKSLFGMDILGLNCLNTDKYKNDVLANI